MCRHIRVVMPFILVGIAGCGSDDSLKDGAASNTDDGPTVIEISDDEASSGGATATLDPDFAAIEGDWETVRMVSAGEEVPPERMRKNMTVTFEEGKMITKRKGEVQATWVITLDSSKSPKQLTINTADPGEKERLSYQIYKIEGDTLTTCSGSREFPSEFTDQTEKGCYLTVRRRVTP